MQTCSYQRFMILKPDDSPETSIFREGEQQLAHSYSQQYYIGKPRRVLLSGKSLLPVAELLLPSCSKAAWEGPILQQKLKPVDGNGITR